MTTFLKRNFNDWLDNMIQMTCSSPHIISITDVSKETYKSGRVLNCNKISASFGSANFFSVRKNVRRINCRIEEKKIRHFSEGSKNWNVLHIKMNRTFGFYGSMKKQFSSNLFTVEYAYEMFNELFVSSIRLMEQYFIACNGRRTMDFPYSYFSSYDFSMSVSFDSMLFWIYITTDQWTTLNDV